MKNVPATVAVVSQLEEKRRQQATDMALGGILKVEVVVRDQSRPGLSRVLDVFDNGRAYQWYKFLSKKKAGKKVRTKGCFFLHPLRNRENNQ